MLAVSLFFTFLYGAGERQSKISISGIVSFVSWWILGFLYLFLSLEPNQSGLTYGTYAVSLFFFGIGILLMIMVIVDFLKMDRIRKPLGDEEEI